jgi:putative ABC transport system permease protein
MWAPRPSRHASALLLHFSVRLYRIALLRYPRELRTRYGEEMVALFEEHARDRCERDGLRGLSSAWWRTAKDLMRPLPGPVERRTEGLEGGGSNRPRKREGTMGKTRWLSAIGEDLGFALRALRREPRFSGLVIGVLAIGIALNVSVFAVLNAYLLRPLPFPNSERLVSVRGWQSVSWNEVDEVFERAVSWDLDVFTIVGEGRPVLARGAWITPDFMEVYAISAQLGRTFRDDEAGRYGAPVAMISHRLWRDHFGGDPDVVGRTFRAFTSDRPDHAELFTIVGVLPADFWYINDYTDVFAPIRGEREVYAGRLHPDVPIERAESVLTEIATARMDEVPPDFRVHVVPLHELHVAEVRPTLLVLQSAVLLVLLIACANAALLLLVRSSRREKELGVRRAMGASDGRLGRQLLFEGCLIAAAAGVTGAALAVLGLESMGGALEARLGRSVPGGVEALGVDVTVLVATVALCSLVGLVFGLVPHLMSGRASLSSTLADGSRGGTESKGRRRVRAVMVTAEIALSLALLTTAGLMVQSAINLERTDLGFSPQGVARGLVGLRQASYPESQARIHLFSELARRAAELPTVEAAGLASSGVFATRFDPRPAEGRRPGGPSYAQAVSWLVDEGYFAVMDIRVLRGRGFTAEDGEGAEGVAVVSESLARDLWGESDPIGRGIRLPPVIMPGAASPDPGPWLRVVGVVEDVVREVGGVRSGDVYRSYRQAGPSWMNVIVRHRPGTPSVVADLEDIVHELDPEVPLSEVIPLEEAVDRAMEPTRYLAGLLAGFSAFALLLAVVGLYGVVSYATRQRRRDVAIRMALGANGRSVVTLFVRQGLAVVAVGVAFGTGGGVLLGRGLEGQLHGVTPHDPLTYVALAGLLALTTGTAVLLPARSASASDPMGVLREE